MRARRTAALGIVPYAGEPGKKSSDANSDAEIMKPPSSAASMRYSGQWRRSASAMAVTRRARRARRAPGAAQRSPERPGRAAAPRPPTTLGTGSPAAGAGLGHISEIADAEPRGEESVTR